MQSPRPRIVRAVVRFLAVAGCSAALTVLALGPATDVPRWPSTAARDVQGLSALDLVNMTDAELGRMDPVAMNLIVARGIPELARLDINRYIRTVDQWAATIDAANRRAEPQARQEATYQVSREFWMAGGMAVSLAGPAFGVGYTTEELDPGKPEQQFLHGVIDQRLGTCASMPVLYLGIAYRLGWPLRAVVSRDHMWVRWDDTAPARDGGWGRASRRGGQRFNLEATTAESDGALGSFLSVSDQDYAEQLGTPPIAIVSRSDMSSQTPRQMLGVFLQSRAGYWAATGNWDEVEQDLLLALRCFPENRDLRFFLAKAQGQMNRRYFTEGECVLLAVHFAPNVTWSAPSYAPSRTPRHGQGLTREDVERINRRSAEQAARVLSPASPNPYRDVSGNP